VVLDDEGDKNDVLRQKRGGQRQYVYDVVFGEDSTQVRKNILFTLSSGSYNDRILAY
jgi:hypothetical protein